MEKVIFRSNELKGSNRCKTRRKRRFVFTGKAQKSAFKRSSVVRAAIMAAMTARVLNLFDADQLKECWERFIDGFESPATGKEKHICSLMTRFTGTVIRPEDRSFSEFQLMMQKFLNAADVAEWTEQKMLSVDFLNKKATKIQAHTAAKWVNRYLTSDSRVPVIGWSQTVDCYGLSVDVRPDVVFTDNGDGSVELVIYRVGAPTVAQRGKTKDASANSSLELYALIQWGRKMFPNTVIRASYYFMRRADDTTTAFNTHFFPYKDQAGHTKNGKNVVSLEDPLSKSAKENFKTLFEEFASGEDACDQTEQTCSECPLNELCNYKPAPLKSENEKERKSAQEVTLSPSQQKAVDFRKGVCRINAGAGAGKTLTASLRYAFMVMEGIDPESILFITFTNSGVSEMRDRVVAYCSDFGIETDPEKLRIMTFNSFGQSIIEAKYKELGFASKPRLIDEIERKQIICSLLDEHVIEGLDYRNFSMNFPYIKGALYTVSAAFAIIKRDGLSIFDADQLRHTMDDEGLTVGLLKDPKKTCEELLKLYDRYDDLLREKALIEYSDQEGLVFDLIEQDPYYLESLGYRHIMVDEYQDTSVRQNELIKLLTECPQFESLMVVGDDSQSIYSFRDATPDNIINFFDYFGEGEDIYLVDNYRSSKEIIDFANSVNRYNVHRVDKNLVSKKGSNGIPVTVKAFSEKDASKKKEGSYLYIVKEIGRLISEENISPNDICVQAATRAELIKLAGFAAEEGIETFVACPEDMMENSRVKAIAALCHAVKTPSSRKDGILVMNSLDDGKLLNEKSDDEINADSEELIQKLVAFNALPERERVEKFDEILDRIAGDDDVALDYSSRLQRFGTIAEKIRYNDSFEAFGGEAMKRTDRVDGVTLTTAHSAKGLEWDVCFVITTKFSSTRDEERNRLFYTACTRAKERLYVVGCDYTTRPTKSSPGKTNWIQSEALTIQMTEN